MCILLIRPAMLPRCRVQVRMEDGTGTASFVLMELEVFKLIGKTAAEIRVKQEKADDDNSFPDDFKDMLGKRVIFKIEISDFNIINSSSVYTVSKLVFLTCVPGAHVKVGTQAVVEAGVDADVVKDGHFDQGCLDTKDDVSVTGDWLPPRFNFINDIDNNKDSLEIKVRIIRLRKQPCNVSNQPCHIGMVLMDEKGERIHAVVKKELIPTFEHLLVQVIQSHLLPPINCKRRTLVFTKKRSVID
ncbi:replication protein A 70 kDa DNA-binding subunit B-like protein [Tanacetum coccineum]|uniref:Replication protein A 70 kDa DNA-binding subunit B-like protein n=1 Tax=Tanacetum coccineum TaxID=301880 RepID=A0ABQ5B0G7_9ASTR